MPDNIVRHCRAVCGVAMYLTRRLDEQGVHLDAEMVRASALLHDITKRYSFNRPLDHALTGYKLLKKLGYPEIAAVVRQHVRMSDDRPSGRISEPEVVNYADKRVLEDKVATLDDRLSYILKRYGRTPEAVAAIEKFSAATYELERDIFSVLPGGPDQLLRIDPLAECGFDGEWG